MHAGETGMSPWVHPKAQEWLGAVFKRSGLIEHLENEIGRHIEEMTIERMRAVIAILILIGHPGIWPAEHIGQLRQIVQALIRRRAGIGIAETRQTIESHQRRNQLLAALDEELETLRRQTGVSKRIVAARRPRTWSKFWQ